MKEISVKELKEMMDKKEDFQLIDVREAYEYESANLGGELIPLATISGEAERISKDKPVIIHCKSGGRSGVAIMQLENKFGFTNLYNLKGGIMAYAREIDPSLTVI
jgi:rhodanese-related sulfurtransferase